jgi:hypothetical protein
VPLVVAGSVDGRLSLVVCALEPVGSEDAAAVLAGAAETALGALGEDDPPVAVDGEGLAGGGHSGQDGAAEDVVLASLAVHPLPVLAGLVELLPLDVELLLVADDRLVETHLVGVVEDGRGLGLEEHQ